MARFGEAIRSATPQHEPRAPRRSLRMGKPFAADGVDGAVGVVARIICVNLRLSAVGFFSVPILGGGGSIPQSAFAVCNTWVHSPIFHQNSFGDSAYSFKFLVLCSLRAKI